MKYKLALPDLYVKAEEKYSEDFYDFLINSIDFDFFDKGVLIMRIAIGTIIEWKNGLEHNSVLETEFPAFYKVIHNFFHR